MLKLAFRSHVLQKSGWFYSILMTVILGLACYLIFSKYRTIRLGKDDERPEFNYLTWLSMLFGAGMGIGLLFYGIAEPIAHLSSPLTARASPEDSARFAMRYSFFHWGLHPWALYALVALAIAYFTFHKGKTGTISATVAPLFNTSSCSALGRTIDTLAVLATVFGIVPSLGIGAQQISGGLSYLFPSVHNTLLTQLTLIGIFTVLYLLSAQTETIHNTSIFTLNIFSVEIYDEQSH
ncbi:BCCT family transporter [Bacillus sp. 165]|nr:BCCT family transporter [Bacillus sp. 165]